MDWQRRLPRRRRSSLQEKPLVLLKDFLGDPNPILLRKFKGTLPLAKQMAEQVTALRQWAKGWARLATSPAAPERRLRKLAG